MTLDEAAKVLQISPNTLKDHFQRTRKTLKDKQNITLIRLGKGKTADYRILVDGVEIDIDLLD